MEIKAITLPESRDKDACYDFFFRVYRWWYNHNNDEALSEELFRERLKPDYCPEEPEPITISEEQMAEIVADLEKIAETM